MLMYLLTQKATLSIKRLIAHKALTSVVVTRAEVKRIGAILVDRTWIANLTQYALGVVGRHHKSRNTLTQRRSGIAEAARNN